MIGHRPPERRRTEGHATRQMKITFNNAEKPPHKNGKENENQEVRTKNYDLDEFSKVNLFRKILKLQAQK
jgi:hypothetical protein